MGWVKYLFSFAAAAAIALVMAVGPVLADDAPIVTNPPAAASSPCFDRWASTPCTVDPGHVQVESDILNVTAQTHDGVTTTTTLIANPTIRYGLSSTVDLELNLPLFDEVQTKTAKGTTVISGVGDTVVRAKVNVLNDPITQIAVIPFVKIPTARLGVGNGAFEGGTVVPLQVNLNKTWTLQMVPEADVLKNADNDGYHLNLQNIINLGDQFTEKWGGSVQIWWEHSFDPNKAETQYSLDGYVSYNPNPNLQIDAGINYGLSKDTPQVQFYTGISHRF